MRPLNGKPTRRGLRRASRGISRGRRATHQVETAYGQRQREQDRMAQWALIQAEREGWAA